MISKPPIELFSLLDVEKVTLIKDYIDNGHKLIMEKYEINICKVENCIIILKKINKIPKLHFWKMVENKLKIVEKETENLKDKLYVDLNLYPECKICQDLKSGIDSGLERFYCQKCDCTHVNDIMEPYRIENPNISFNSDYDRRCYHCSFREWYD